MSRARVVVVLLACCGVSVLFASRAHAYSVLAHEANVDVLWDTAIVPVLKQRFPRVTTEELVDARAYAYGGCVIQDLGTTHSAAISSATCCTTSAPAIS